MQVKQKEINGLKHCYEVTISAEKIQQRVSDKLIGMASRVKLPGFRPGKVPQDIVKKHYEQSVRSEEIEKLVSETMQEVMREKGIKPAMEPVVTDFSEKDGAIIYSFEIENLPDVVPGNIDGIKLTRYNVVVSDGDIDKDVEEIRSNLKKWEDAEKVAAEGDRVLVDLFVKSKDKRLNGSKIDDFPVDIGSGRVPFETALIGSKSGDDCVFDVKVPKTTYSMKVKKVQCAGKYDLDESFAKALGYDTLEALKEEVKKRLEKESSDHSKTKLKRHLLDTLDDMYSFDIPAGMVELEFENIWRQYYEELKSEGNISADYNEDEVKEEYRRIAERRVRLGLLVAEVGKEKNISVSNKEVVDAVRGIAMGYPGREKEVFDAYLKNSNMLTTVRASIFEEKVVDYIISKAEITEKDVSVAEMVKLIEEDGEFSFENKKEEKAASK